MASIARSQMKQNYSKPTATDRKWKWPSTGKENENPSLQLKSRIYTNQAEQVVRDVKANATKTFMNVKTTLDNISQKLRRSSRKRSSSSFQPYDELDNKVTPVKLYSPFGIETPSPINQAHARIIQGRRRLTPKRFNFVSPTGKFKKDIEELETGMKELHTVAKSVQNRRSR